MVKSISNFFRKKTSYNVAWFKSGKCPCSKQAQDSVELLNPINKVVKCPCGKGWVIVGRHF